ncbi:transposase family protein [Streptomyces sp. NPDC052236]|uniref:transposase family protein n=1 Tax=Streptomyces sp. NPDC052236 TaxID=3365686 RepID=UPI0037D112F6
MSAAARGFTWVTHVAKLDVPRHVVDHLSRLPAAHRRRIGTPRGSRALGPFRQAVLVLRWFRERGCVHCLARDAGIAQATGYRYLHEGIDILADQAPDPHKVLDRCRREAMTHVILDDTLIESDRLAGVRDNGNGNGNDLWFSQKHKAFGGNVQFLAAPDGTPLWVCDVEPGSTHSPRCTAQRPTACPPWPTRGLHRRRNRHPRPGPAAEGPLRTGPACQHTHHEQPDQRLHALGERAAAELKQRWRTLQHTTLSPSRIGDIASPSDQHVRRWRRLNDRR